MENKPISEGFVFPLSFAQQRLWFLDQLEPGSPLYNTPHAFRMSGILDVQALQQTFEAIVSRHESLRTTFSDVEGVPMQCIAEKGAISLPVIDLTSLPEADREGEAQRLAAEEFRRPFNLAQGPLLRLNLLRLSDKEHILLLTLHHIVTDGWSMGILVQEMATIYEAFSHGTVPSLPELPIQYADFAEWQRKWLEGEMLESQISYWKEQLGGKLPIVELPTDHPRPAFQTYRGKKKTRVLPKTLHEALKALSHREGVTLFMTLLAAFQTLLHSYTGQDDIIVGSATANRNRLEIEGLIGFFVNTLVLRTDLSGNPTFRDLLKRVREVALGAYAHEDLPFEKLVEELQVPRDPSYNPLFQVMFVLQNVPMVSLQLSGITLTPLEAETDTAKFDLMLELTEGPEGLTSSIEYNTDLFESDTIERMAAHYQILLQGIVANPNARLSELPLLTDPERHQLLVEWKTTQTDYPRDKCIHELFEEQVERTPDAVALVFEDQRLTYKELNRRANQLAYHLRKHGVGPDALVGICMERSLEMVVGLLGILKAGGAYVPLDAVYPKERLEFMVKDTGIAVLLTQRRMIPVIPAGILKTLCLDTEWETVVGETDQNVPACSTADSLAYVMYTSGSTGTPKGVEVLQRGVVRLVINTNYARLNEKEIFLLMAPISFDASTFELWAGLLNGATCIVYPAGVPSADKLADIIRRHSVSTLWLTSSLFNAVIDEDPQALRGISQLLIGGEQLSAPHVLRAQEALPGTQIINGYGPTENTTFTCCYPIPQGLPRDTKTIPIGRPIANTDVYILDKHLQLVPVGVPGQLYTGGDGLARGYLNRPDLTNEMFIPQPFSTEPDARLYKTGDLARWRADGNIEFLGRIDHQVKIRGFRIELGEIESVLGEHEAVREVVVMAREDVPGDKRLVAYIIPEGKQTPSVSLLRQYLKEKLPEYMVPNVFVMVEKLPLTPSGKVDRRALPAPEHTRPELEATYVAPRTPVEQSLVEIWASVLGVERVGINDNFFELGGYSLLAVQLFVRIRKWAGIDLPLATLFKSPTVRGLAELIDPSCAVTPISGETISHISSPSQQWRSLVPIHPEGNRPPVFLIHAVGGNLLYYFCLLNHLGPDQPVYGLQARGVDGVLSPHSSIEEMASHYIAEIRSVQSSGPYFLGGASFGGTVAFEIAWQLTQQGEEVAFLALLDTFGPGPLGYRSWGSVRRRLSRVQGDIMAQQAPLPVYLSKRIYRYLSNRMQTLRLGFACLAKRLTKRPIPLELREAYLWRGHFKALTRYLPHQYLGSITLFRGPEENTGSYNDPELGWKDIARGELKIIIIPASHHEFVESAELGAQFAENLKEAQDKAQGSSLTFNGLLQDEVVGVNKSEGERIRVSH
jgi:aspartate racemase